MTTADTFFRSFLSDKMFAVNRFVAAPNGTVSASVQNHSTRGATYELAERPNRLLLAGSGVCVSGYQK